MYYHTTKTLSSGCSFTAGCWEEQLNKHFKHYDSAYPGAGNKYIADSIIHLTSQEHYDCVLVMWSGLTRLDTPITNHSYFGNYFNQSLLGQTAANTKYIMSGGQVGNWLNDPMAKLLYENIYKFMSFQDLALMSLLEMVKLQGYLKSKNIKYYFMSYINYWNQSQDWTSPNLDQGLNNYPILNDTIKQIDFDQWIFLNDNKDGVFELAQSNNDFLDDKYHPGATTQRIWGEFILDRIAKDGLLDVNP